MPGSPAINAGSSALLPADVNDLDGDLNTTEPIPFDQRGTGFNRVRGGQVDMGAFEVQQPTVVARHIFYENSAFDDPDGFGPQTGAGPTPATTGRSPRTRRRCSRARPPRLPTTRATFAASTA